MIMSCQQSVAWAVQSVWFHNHTTRAATFRKEEGICSAQSKFSNGIISWRNNGKFNPTPHCKDCLILSDYLLLEDQQKMVQTAWGCGGYLIHLLYDLNRDTYELNRDTCMSSSLHTVSSMGIGSIWEASVMDWLKRPGSCREPIPLKLGPFHLEMY